MIFIVLDYIVHDAIIEDDEKEEATVMGDFFINLNFLIVSENDR
jgi:hypothetical protein